MTSSRAPTKIIPRAFPGISAKEVIGLIACSQVKEYPPETILCRENEVEDIFYLILEGEVEVTKVINNAEIRHLKSLGPGDFFGEMALIHNSPRAATVKTTKPLVALEIRKEDFDQVLRDSPSISLAMVREISRRLRENDELAIDDLRLRARELADAYQKMAEMEAARHEFLTNVSHKLRTPLTSAGGFLQMLQKGAFPAEKIPEIIDTIANNVQQITSLVNDILFIQEMDLIFERFEPVEMGVIAKKVVGHYQEIAGQHKVKLKITSDMLLPSVLGDPASLERALAALVDNAIKFSPEGGDVTIRLQRRGSQVSVSVKDEGIGIEPEILPRIFDRFFHLDQSGAHLFEGLGIGLAIARQVIEQHRGHIEVDSQPGRGSTFTMWLNTGRKPGRENDPAVTL